MTWTSLLYINKPRVIYRDEFIILYLSFFFGPVSKKDNDGKRSCAIRQNVFALIGRLRESIDDGKTGLLYILIVLLI